MSILSLLINSIMNPVKKHVKGKYGEIKVKEELQSNNYLVISNSIFEDEANKTFQIDHILLDKKGIFCIETKNINGRIIGNPSSNKWISINGTIKNCFQNPLNQNYLHCKKLSVILHNKYKIYSLVVFVNNNVSHLNIGNVIDLRELKSYLLDFKSDYELDATTIVNIKNYIESKICKITDIQHAKTVVEQGKSYGICPLCNNKLLLKSSKYGDFYGCSNYPKCKYTRKK